MTNTVKRRDTHSITFTVRDSAGVPVSLAGSTVRLLARPVAGGATAVLSSSLGVGTGTVTHTLTGLLDATSYYVEVEVTDGAGVITTSPSDGYTLLVIEPDLL